RGSALTAGVSQAEKAEFRCSSIDSSLADRSNLLYELANLGVGQAPPLSILDHLLSNLNLRLRTGRYAGLETGYLLLRMEQFFAQRPNVTGVRLADHYQVLSEGTGVHLLWRNSLLFRGVVQVRFRFRTSSDFDLASLCFRIDVAKSLFSGN